MQGSVALVTGGGSGIGRATALAFAARGARVIIADIDVLHGEESARLVNDVSEAHFIVTDVSRAEQVETLLARTFEIYGRVDFAFNNAGMMGPFARAHEYSEAAWETVVDVNLKSVWLCMKYELQIMLKQRGGAIVNTASVGGLVGSSMGAAAYVASKHGVIGLTKATALEYAQDGIRINAVCPGITRTAMVAKNRGTGPEVEQHLLASYPIKRMGEPEDIAEAVMWLCSATFVTGQAIAIDGGFTAQ